MSNTDPWIYYRWDRVNTHPWIHQWWGKGKHRPLDTLEVGVRANTNAWIH
jgi:hypothetical protein